MPAPRSAVRRGTTTIAAASLAAAALLGASAVPPGTEPDVKACSTQPELSAEQRIAGIQADMARAVELRQVTSEQAAFVAGQLVRRIQAGVLPSQATALPGSPQP